MSRVALVVLALLGGCSEPAERRYRIDGAASDFCVPRPIEVSLPDGSPAGDVVAGGFAVAGCRESEPGRCLGPAEVIAFSVSDPASFPDRGYGAGGGHVRERSARHRDRAEPVGGGMLAIPVDALPDHPDATDFPHDTDGFDLWKVSDADAGGMAADDELLATCERDATDAGFRCNRTVRGPDYRLSYSFYAPGALPVAFDALDDALVRAVDGLRCGAEQDEE